MLVLRTVDVIVDRTRLVPRTAVVKTEVMTVMDGPALWVLFPEVPEGAGLDAELPPLIVL